MAENRQDTENRGSSEVTVHQRQRPSVGPARRDSMSPFGLLQEMSNEMSRIFSRFPFAMGMGGMEMAHDMWTPRVDVLRKGDNIVVRADLPGLTKDDIAVDVTENRLTIRGERREESEEEREGYYWHERSEGSFYRTIPIPEGADIDHAAARFENGVLEISLPAPREEQMRSRRIEIR
jgi:HSP20 family protein